VASLRRAAQGILANDLMDIVGKKNCQETETKVLVDARVGQGTFRKDVLQLWESCCSVTGASTLDAIRASHIKPWRTSTNDERLDPKNGLPLVASLDALFDVGLISFESSGRMLVSRKLPMSERKIFDVIGKALTKTPGSDTARYLLYHRQYVFLT
jgi:predicted restriction endonuclease